MPKQELALLSADGFAVTAEMSRAALGDKIGQVAASLGLPHFLLVELPRADRTTLEETLIATNWPDALLRRYRTSDILFCSNIMTAFRRTIKPISMGSEAFACAAANRASDGIELLFKSHGAERTFGFTLHDVDLRVYGLTFSGKRANASRIDEMEAIFASQNLLDDCASGLPNNERRVESLAPREVECLRWTAAGKSSEEIGIILSISHHTVVAYLKNAMRKLNSVNRMQAVAMAYRHRFI